MSSQSTIYRPDPRTDLTARATRAATVVAVVLATIGAASMMVGVAGAAGVSQVGAMRSTLCIGLGLAAIGSGGFLLLILQGMRDR